MRRSKPLRLSSAGQRLLRLAERILPEMEALEADFAGLRVGRTGRMHIAIECHACFEWLLPVLEGFRKSWPDVDVDIRPGLAFEALPALMREDVDLVVASDPENLAGVTFEPLFDYEAMFVAASAHPLAKSDWVEAEDFRDQTLITYPVDRTRLDVFSQLLIPARVEPRRSGRWNPTAVILLLVASQRGVSVLPDWVVREVRTSADYVTRPMTEGGVTRRLYAAVREAERASPTWPNSSPWLGRSRARCRRPELSNRPQARRLGVEATVLDASNDFMAVDELRDAARTMEPALLQAGTTPGRRSPAGSAAAVPALAAEPLLLVFLDGCDAVVDLGVAEEPGRDRAAAPAGQGVELAEQRLLRRRSDPRLDEERGGVLVRLVFVAA